MSSDESQKEKRRKYFSPPRLHAIPETDKARGTNTLSFISLPTAPRSPNNTEQKRLRDCFEADEFDEEKSTLTRNDISLRSKQATYVDASNSEGITSYTSSSLARQVLSAADKSTSVTATPHTDFPAPHTLHPNEKTSKVEVQSQRVQEEKWRGDKASLPVSLTKDAHKDKSTRQLPHHSHFSRLSNLVAVRVAAERKSGPDRDIQCNQHEEVQGCSTQQGLLLTQAEGRKRSEQTKRKADHEKAKTVKEKTRENSIKGKVETKDGSSKVLLVRAGASKPKKSKTLTYDEWYVAV